MSKAARILLIEDSEDDALLIERVLNKDGLEPFLQRVSNADEMNRALEENNWDAVENEEQRYNRNSKLLTLGNLAIITSSLNSSIRDSSWEIKVNGQKDKKGLKEFTAGLETMNNCLDLAQWNETTIKNRAAFLAQKALEVWKS